MDSEPDPRLGVATGSEWFKAPDEDQSENEIWESWLSQVAREDLACFKFPMLDHLRHQPYHGVTLEGPFNLASLVKDHRAALFRSHTVLNRRARPRADRLLFALGEGRFAYYEHGDVTVYAPTHEAVVALSARFRAYLHPPGPKTVGFHMLSAVEGALRTEFIRVERLPTLSDDALALHYGPDFPDWEKQWVEQLYSRRCGVSLLFGPPGGGKTTFLRALMGKLIDQFVFYYLPISEFAVLASPTFVGFWIAETRRRGKKQKVAILEDAEELLLPRDDRSRDKLSNLLNIADGFLGDHLKLHIIATTNVPIRNLDPAVTRPGRLLGSREFGRLSRAAAQRLVAAQGIPLPDQPDYSLAEIYCQVPVGRPAAKSTRLGFGK